MVERDKKGRPSKWVTETEPEYDVNERDSWHALDEYEDSLCPQCGQLRSICEDPSQPWSPQEHVCYATAARAMATRNANKPYEKTQPDGDGWHPRDGAMTYVVPEEPPSHDSAIG